MIDSATKIPEISHRVHFDPKTGAVVGHVTSNTHTPIDGYDSVEVALLHGISHRTHRVDIDTHTVVEMTVVEKAAANVPTDFQVRALIFRELRTSDNTQTADYPATLRAQWGDYRQALRDLSKIANPTVANMLAAFPVRPDGIDAAASLKKRLPR